MDSPALRDEPARVAALIACAVMDTPREASFDNIVFTTAQIFRATMVALTLVGTSRVWVKASVGPMPREWERASSFCNHIITSNQVTVIEDATVDSRFSSFPAVLTDPKVRFVAGAPLRGPEGYRVGALCVFDRIPRTVSDRQRAQLLQLAEEAGELLRLRVPNLDLDMTG